MSLAWASTAPLRSWGADAPDAGFLFDEFNLTLAPGHRTEALGPFYYSEQQETKRIWAVPPLLSYTRDPDTESKEFDFLYPVMTYDRHGDQYRWQFLQLLSFSGGPTQQETARDRFTVFPLYFQQRSSDTSQNYTALFPFYGHLENQLFPGRNLLRHVASLQPDAKAGRGDGQLSGAVISVSATVTGCAAGSFGR